MKENRFSGKRKTKILMYLFPPFLLKILLSFLLDFDLDFQECLQYRRWPRTGCLDHKFLSLKHRPKMMQEKIKMGFLGKRKTEKLVGILPLF